MTILESFYLHTKDAWSQLLVLKLNVYEICSKLKNLSFNFPICKIVKIVALDTEAKQIS